MLQIPRYNLQQLQKLLYRPGNFCFHTPVIMKAIKERIFYQRPSIAPTSFSLHQEVVDEFIHFISRDPAAIEDDVVGKRLVRIILELNEIIDKNEKFSMSSKECSVFIQRHRNTIEKMICNAIVIINK